MRWLRSFTIRLGFIMNLDTEDFLSAYPNTLGVDLREASLDTLRISRILQNDPEVWSDIKKHIIDSLIDIRLVPTET
jgi:hypothetical protein